METTIVYWGYIGIKEKKMETTIVYWGYIGIMENNMETTIVYCGYFSVNVEHADGVRGQGRAWPSIAQKTFLGCLKLFPVFLRG